MRPWINSNRWDRIGSAQVRMPPKVPSKGAGFTLLEVMVASVSASILALTVSSMLFFAWRNFQDLGLGIDVQSDVRAAVGRMSTLVRAAADSDITVGAGQVIVATAGPTHRFWSQGSDLMYDPDTAIENDEVTLVRGGLLSFDPSKNVLSEGRVMVSLDLRLRGDFGRTATRVRSTVFLRN